MRHKYPQRFTNHPVLLMLAVLKQGRRQAMRDMQRSHRKFHLPHYGVGAVLAEFGPLSQKEVSERMGIDPSDIIPIIDAMERAGLMERLRDAADRRRYQLTLTDAGKQFIQTMDQYFTERSHNFLAPLTPEEQKQFMVLLRKLLR